MEIPGHEEIFELVSRFVGDISTKGATNEQGNLAHVVLVPNLPKIKALKQRQAREKQNLEAESKEKISTDATDTEPSVDVPSISPPSARSREKRPFKSDDQLLDSKRSAYDMAQAEREHRLQCDQLDQMEHLIIEEERRLQKSALLKIRSAKLAVSHSTAQSHSHHHHHQPHDAKALLALLTDDERRVLRERRMTQDHEDAEDDSVVRDLELLLGDSTVNHHAPPTNKGGIRKSPRRDRDRHVREKDATTAEDITPDNLENSSEEYDLEIEEGG